METVLYALGIIALGLYAVCVVIMVVSFLRAPSGYEDEEGFHFANGAAEPTEERSGEDRELHHPHLPAPGVG